MRLNLLAGYLCDYIKVSTMIRSLAVVFGCLMVGELLVYFTRVPVPSSIIGMVLLTTLLYFKWIPLGWVKLFADVMVKNLAFFFIPSGVAIMLFFDLIAQEWLPILVSVWVGTFAIMTVVGWVYQWMKRSHE